MSNEQLVALIQAGATEYMEQLWEQVRNLVLWKARRIMSALEARGNPCGCTLDDLGQTGYVALVAAVDSYKPEGGAFSSWLMFGVKNQSSFKFTFHILANGGLAWKYRLFRHFPFGRYLAYRSTTRQVFSFKSSTKVVNRALTTKRPCFRKLSVPPAVPLHGAFRCGPFLPWLSYRLHGRNSSASW